MTVRIPGTSADALSIVDVIVISGISFAIIDIYEYLIFKVVFSPSGAKSRVFD